MKRLLMSIWGLSVLGVVVAIVVALAGKPKEARDLDWDGTIVPMAQRLSRTAYPTVTASESTISQPLRGLRVVITGATNGIGLALTKAMVKLGAHVIAMGRSPTLLQSLQDELGSDSISTVQANLMDLSSVARAADELVQKWDRVDIIINNAGIHDGTSWDTLIGTRNFTTPQGHDRVFTVNYLSHVLWTEKLLPALGNSEHPTVIQISSLYHMEADGSDLVPVKAASGETLPPVAARPGGSPGFFIFRSMRSYANSKLAQLYHARSLKRLHPHLRTVSVCPAYVGTQLAGPKGTPEYDFFHSIGYPVDGWGIASPLHAILSGDKEAGDFYSNTHYFDAFNLVFRLMPSWAYKWGIRDVVANAMAYSGMIGQHYFSHAAPRRSSAESYNEDIGDALYQWSYEAVSPYLTKAYS